LAIWQELRHTEGIAIALSNLGVAAIELGAPTEAASYLEQGVELARRLGFTSQLLNCLQASATVAVHSGKPERAACLVAALDRQLAATDTRLSTRHRIYREEAIRAYEAALTEAQLAEALEAGRAMSIAEAVDYGLETVRSAAAHDSASAGRRRSRRRRA
jgi:hypothetical protein